jgi:hypothetical protein
MPILQRMIFHLPFPTDGASWEVSCCCFVEQTILQSEVAAYVPHADWTIDDLSLEINPIHQRMTLGHTYLRIKPGKRPPLATAYAANGASANVDKYSWGSCSPYCRLSREMESRNVPNKSAEVGMKATLRHISTTISAGEWGHRLRKISRGSNSKISLELPNGHDEQDLLSRSRRRK